MPGMRCPKCGEQTFFQTPKGRKCSKCSYEMTTLPNSGKGGQGKRCFNCGRNTVFNGKCTKCGAVYK